MGRKSIALKILAITGTVLVWFPFLFMVLTSLFALITRHVFRFDYLMPAEMFPLELAGFLLLLCASLLVKAQAPVYWKVFVCGFAAALVFLAGSQIIAVTGGLASGEAEPVGWVWALVVTGIVVYSLALIGIGIAGITFIKKIFALK